MTCSLKPFPFFFYHKKNLQVILADTVDSQLAKNMAVFVKLFIKHHLHCHYNDHHNQRQLTMIVMTIITKHPRCYSSRCVRGTVKTCSQKRRRWIWTWLAFVSMITRCLMDIDNGHNNEDMIILKETDNGKKRTILKILLTTGAPSASFWDRARGQNAQVL